MKRDIAYITIEAQTPLKVGTKESSFFIDSPVQKDWNALPMILGSSIAGVLRSSFEKKEAERIFGKEEGSKVIFSNALLVINDKDEVCEELLLKDSEFISYFKTLPVREHTAIDDKGVAKEHSKFDEEVVYKGSRFKFLVEMIDDKESFEKLLELLQRDDFRLGGGSTKGFGKFKVIKIESKSIESAKEYLNYTSSLNSKNIDKELELNRVKSDRYTTYTLKITPENFFMFGSGFGDEDADMTPIYEKVIDYKKMKLSQKKILIPASSIKGALAHRTAFYYNKAMGATIENSKGKIGEDNDAVREIFGHKKELEDDKELGQKGKVLFSDCYKDKKENSTKVFDHVMIDRFTGGAKDGALFQEKTVTSEDEWEIEILLENSVDEKYRNSFEKAMKDIVNGMLPLGGATTKGHGVFIGKLYKDGEEI